MNEVPASCKVFTAPDLADAVVAAIRGPGDAGTWLDPCVGPGAFASALERGGIDTNRLTCIDIEEQSELQGTALSLLTGVDFLEWAREVEDRFDRVVANPPYVSLSRLPSNLRRAASCWTDVGGDPVSPSSNYWYVFLLAALRVLANGGNLAFVLPAAWDYADYATHLRERIHTLFKEVVVVRCAEPLFDDVRDGCVVLVALGFNEDAGLSYREDAPTRERAIEALHRVPMGVQPRRRQASRGTRKGVVMASEVLRISIGAVTGDVSYFLMDESTRRRWALPVGAVTPVLSRARHLISASIGRREWAFLRDQGERVWLFRPEGEWLHVPQVLQYLRHGTNGACRVNARKVARRDPWHRTTLPRSPDGFLSGMAKEGPLISFRAWGDLTATNTLYCCHFLKRVDEVQRSGWALSIAAAARHDSAGRRYPDGLVKFEPRDVGELELKIPPRSAENVPLYEAFVVASRDGRRHEADLILKEWVR